MDLLDGSCHEVINNPQDPLPQSWMSNFVNEGWKVEADDACPASERQNPMIKCAAWPPAQAEQDLPSPQSRVVIAWAVTGTSRTTCLSFTNSLRHLATMGLTLQYKTRPRL